MQHLKTIEEVEAFFLKHGENIVDLIGGEVDRIEKQLKVRVYYFALISFSLIFNLYKLIFCSLSFTCHFFLTEKISTAETC